MTLATIPMGYFEGIDRRLSNNGFVYIRGVSCPIVGRVSMNISSIDVSALKGVELNETVEVISPVASQKNSIESIAKICDTIPYEVAVHVGMHLKRVIID
jgi:alanine racemase